MPGNQAQMACWRRERPAVQSIVVEVFPSHPPSCEPTNPPLAGAPPTCCCSLPLLPSPRDPWVLPAAAAARQQASLIRARLSSDAGGASDHLATIKAFNQWKSAAAVGPGRCCLYCVFAGLPCLPASTWADQQREQPPALGVCFGFPETCPLPGAGQLHAQAQPSLHRGLPSLPPSARSPPGHAVPAGPPAARHRPWLLLPQLPLPRHHEHAGRHALAAAVGQAGAGAGRRQPSVPSSAVSDALQSKTAVLAPAPASWLGPLLCRWCSLSLLHVSQACRPSPRHPATRPPCRAGVARLCAEPGGGQHQCAALRPGPCRAGECRGQRKCQRKVLADAPLQASAVRVLAATPWGVGLGRVTNRWRATPFACQLPALCTSPYTVPRPPNTTTTTTPPPPPRPAASTRTWAACCRCRPTTRRRAPRC